MSAKAKLIWTEILLAIVVILLLLASMGCTTSKVDGSKKLLGVVKIPFTKNVEAISAAAAKEIAMVDQFAPFVWASLFCIIGGATLWWFTKGSTGAGRFFVGLGIALAAFAVTLEKYAGVIGLVALVGAIGAGCWMVYDFVIKKKAPTE